MEVARTAARETVSNLNASIEHPMPGQALPPTCATDDPGRLFTRVSHAVRQAMALETRIAAGDVPPLRTPPQPHERRHAPANQTPARPAQPANRPSFRLEAAEALEDEFFAITDNRPVTEILAAIREVLGLAQNRPTNRPAQQHRRTSAVEPKPPDPRVPALPGGRSLFSSIAAPPAPDPRVPALPGGRGSPPPRPG